MCLSKITGKAKTTKRWLVRWKVFSGDALDAPWFIACDINGNPSVPLGQELEAERVVISKGTDREYESGFHVYRTFEDARKSRFLWFLFRPICKVRISGEIMSGEEDGVPVDVASKMLVKRVDWEHRTCE